MPCRLLLLDDHPTLTRGLAALLEQEPDLEVGGQFASGEALLAFLEATPPPAADLLLLDLYLPPPLDGLTLLPHLRRTWPALRVLVFSSATSQALVLQVAAAGGHGFVDKSAEVEALLAAIRAVHRGQLVFPARVQARPLPGTPPTQQPNRGPASLPTEALLRLHRLSAREREVVGLVREGLTTRAIAERLRLTALTVSTHRRNLMRKLGVHSVAELVRFAHEHGL